MRWIFCCLALSANHCTAQSADSLYIKALHLKKQFEFRASLDLFSRLLRSDSGNVAYLAETSYLYAKLGYSIGSESEQARYYDRAQYLAVKAIRTDSESVPAHYAYVVAMGRLTEHASDRKKLKNARLIKEECDWILKHEPDHAGTWHVLGRWHREFAKITALEKFFVKNLLGGWPEGGTWYDAILCFTRAKQLEPDIIFHYYELALTYHMRNQDYRDLYAARMLLEEALAISIDTDDVDQVHYRELSAELLRQLR